MMNVPPPDRVYEIFRLLNDIPRPSHHEAKVADFLCDFALKHHLDYSRDDHNCVVIRKDATPGYETARPIVVLNHMDMVCVGMDDPLGDVVVPYVENGWMKAKGTSLGADNGIGLAMALAMLENDDIVHGPIEVLTTTNEEDGMTGAANLSGDFVNGRWVINLDSEDYDTITIGAAGALLQEHVLPFTPQAAPGGKRRWYRITISGGKGGHSGVDINKRRTSATVLSWAMLAAIYNEYDIELASIRVGESNASIATSAEMVVTVPSGEAAEFVRAQEQLFNEWVCEEYGDSDPDVRCRIEKVTPPPTVIPHATFDAFMLSLEQIQQGVISMSDTMPGTVETSNNVGRIFMADEGIVVTTHTRSFIDAEMENVARDIAKVFEKHGGKSRRVMTTPAWYEDTESAYLKLVSDCFRETLGWKPRPVAMHFVLEAGCLVHKFPGMQIACIGPKIVEPHSTSERVLMSTVDDIWKTFVCILRRCADVKSKE